MRVARLIAAILLILPGLAAAQAPGSDRWPVVHERKDARGRLVRRFVIERDGAIHSETYAYGKDSAKLTLEEDLDPSRVSQRRVREKFDERGRITEREETSDKEGRRKGKRTRFRYDAAGQQTAETTDIEE